MKADVARLQAAVEVTRRAARRLEMSLATDRPLLDVAIDAAEESLDEERLRALDAFVQRYQQLVEHMTHRFYPAIYRREEYGGRPPSVRTLMNIYEGADVLLSARDWEDRAELRNRLVHEYPLDPEERARALTAAIAQSSLMLADLDRGLAYIQDRKLLEAEDD